MVKDFVRRLFTDAIKWREQKLVKLVVFLTVLPRITGYPGAPERFSKAKDRFNDEINRTADYLEGIVVKNVAGFQCPQDETPLPVEEWSPMACTLAALLTIHHSTNTSKK